MSESSRTLFATAIGEAEQTALLLDSAGVPLAGSYVDNQGRDISAEVGSALSGVGREVSRSMRLLSLGAWTAVVVETDAATIALAPGPQDSMVLLASASTVPLGLVRRVLTRSVALAINWMQGARMKGALAEIVATLSHLPGVVAAMIVGASDGLIVETSPMKGAAVGGADSRKHTAALAAYLYSKVTRASDAARLGTPAFMRLEAERGQICVVGARDVVLVTIVTSDANLGRVRLDMMKAARGKS